MKHDRPRWRLRISTLMLLVIIAALASALVVERWKRVGSERRALAEAQRAEAEARLALARALRARAQVAQAKAQAKAVVEAERPTPISPQETPGQATLAGAERKEGGP
jgi:hypothetical protein